MIKHVVYVYLGNQNGKPVAKLSVSALPKEAEHIDDELLFSGLAPYDPGSSFSECREYTSIRQRQRKIIESGWTLSNWHIVKLEKPQTTHQAE